MYNLLRYPNFILQIINRKNISKTTYMIKYVDLKFEFKMKKNNELFAFVITIKVK